jgi:hypothetical protein
MIVYYYDRARLYFVNYELQTIRVQSRTTEEYLVTNHPIIFEILSCEGKYGYGYGVSL